MSITSEITATQAVTGAQASSASSAARNGANYNAFLQLLVTELKNQDPLKPLDPTQTVSQLATFAGVEQAVQTNALLSVLADSSALSQASALVGRTIESADGAISGTVKSVIVDNNGLIAVLTDGKRIPLGPGITIS